MLRCLYTCRSRRNTVTVPEPPRSKRDITTMRYNVRDASTMLPRYAIAPPVLTLERCQAAVRPHNVDKCCASVTLSELWYFQGLRGNCTLTTSGIRTCVSCWPETREQVKPSGRILDNWNAFVLTNKIFRGYLFWTLSTSLLFLRSTTLPGWPAFLKFVAAKLSPLSIRYPKSVSRLD